MTIKQHRLYHNRSQTDNFLFHTADSGLFDEGGEKRPPADQDGFKKTFPDILFGDEFAESAANRFENTSAFSAMVIRIDGLRRKSGSSKQDQTATLFVETAKISAAICKKENGIWGVIDSDSIGVFFPEVTEAATFKLAEKITKKMKNSHGRTLSIGIASYPTIHFGKSQILENARKAFDHAAFFGPDSIVAFDAVSINISGDKLYQHGDIQGAVEEFKTALLLDPANVNVHNSLGVCYGVMQEHKKALEEFETAIELDDTEVMAVYNAGLINMLTGNKEKALEYFLSANNIKENMYEVVLQTGILFLEMEKPDDAKKFIEKAVKRKTDSGMALRYLGDCYTDLDMPDEAVKAYKKAVKLSPNDAAALSALGSLFEKSGENSEIALTFCRQSVEIAPENGLYQHRLGQMYLKQNHLKDALKSFKKASELGYESASLINEVKKRMGSK